MEAARTTTARTTLISKNNSSASNGNDKSGNGSNKKKFPFRTQVELFLDQDDDIEGVSRGSTVLRRIDQALQLNHKDFVTHDSCQQVPI